MSPTLPNAPTYHAHADNLSSAMANLLNRGSYDDDGDFCIYRTDDDGPEGDIREVREGFAALHAYVAFQPAATAPDAGAAHSAEPWRTDAQTGLAYGYLEDGRRVFDCGATPLDPAQARANAERIVACVNALAGIPTAQLMTLQPGQLHRALRYLGHEIRSLDDQLGYFDGGLFFPFDCDLPAILATQRLQLPVPEEAA